MRTRRISTLIRVLALRTAELHRALAQPTDDPACSTRSRCRRADLDAYRQRALDEARSALELLSASLERCSAADRERAVAVLAQRDADC